MQTTRRVVLTAALGAGVLGTVKVFLRRRRPTRSRSLDALVDSMFRSSQKDILETTARALREGASAEQLLSAAFLAPLVSGGVEDLHVLLVVPSVYFHFLALDSRLERLLPVFWCVSNAQSWSKPEREAAGGQAKSIPDPAAALQRAFQDEDPTGADLAAAALVEASGARATMVQLALEASRTRADPHLAILAAQSARLLPALGDAYAAPVLRFIARRLAGAGPPAADPTPPRLNEADPTPAVDIARALLGGPEVRLDGFSSAAVWEALAMLALQTRLADDSVSGVGVHRTTLLDALCFIHDGAPVDQRPQVLARAVQAVRSLEDPGRPAIRIGLHSPDATSPRQTAFDAARERAHRDLSRFVEEIRAEVALKGSGEHDFKYFSAVESLAPRFSPAFREHWWAGAALAHPVGSAYPWDRAEEAGQLISRLGPA